MSENLTISQLAKELNVSRQKIYRFLDKPENSHVHEYIYINSKKIKMINNKGVRFIKENIHRTDFFIKQIEQKDAQIHTLQQIIEKNQNLLDQQQRLALQDKKLLEEYKAEINDLKAL